MEVRAGYIICGAPHQVKMQVSLLKNQEKSFFFHHLFHGGFYELSNAMLPWAQGHSGRVQTLTVTLWCAWPQDCTQSLPRVESG